MQAEDSKLDPPVAENSSPVNNLDSPFQLGEWRVNPLSQTLSSAKEHVQLPAKVMAVLTILAHNHHRLVTRSEIIAAIWDGNDYVGENGVTNAIWKIRQIYNNRPDLIKTVPKTGYQLQLIPEFDRQPVTEGSSKRYWRWLPLFVGLSIVLLYFVLENYRANSVNPLVEPALSLFVGMPGRELNPRPSPDGRYVAFQAVGLQGQRDIYLKSTENSSEPPKQVTFSSQAELSPSWNVTGKYLAFIRKGDSSDDCNIVVMEVASLEETLLNKCVHSEYTFNTLSWSPDGQWLIHRYANLSGPPGLYLWRFDEENMRLHLHEPQRISCLDCDYIDEDVSWSPDSKKLAITRSRNRFSADIYLYTLSDGSFERLTSGERSIKGHVWYRDNRSLVYVANRGPHDRFLRVLDTRTGESKNLGVAGAGFPAFSPDYENLYLYRRVIDTHISSVSLKQPKGSLSVSPAPVIQTAYSERSPAVERLSNTIAYISNATGFDELWVANIDGTEAKQLTFLQGYLEDPAWSPNGKYIVFISAAVEDEINKVRVLEVNTGRIQTLPTEMNYFGAPAWSADGESVLVPAREQGVFNLWEIRINNNKGAHLLAINAEFGREDLEGEFIYYSKSNESGLYRLSAEGASKLVSSGWESNYGWANWDWISEDELIYSEVKGDQILLSRLSISDSKVTTVFALPLRTIHRHGRLSYSPVSEKILFTYRELPQIDIWLMKNPLLPD